jgi:anaerobic dimethyl sulfoxide reductase subunit A
MVIETLGESKSHFEIANELASHLGIPNYSDKTEDEWLRELVCSDVPDYDDFKKKGFYKIKLLEPHVALRKEIEEPERHPFPTPSGKIEIYSQYLANMNHPELPPIPKYIQTWESRNDPLAREYPLQLISTHFRRRANTQFEKVPWLKELLPQVISINPIDAKARNINDGDNVRVFNGRGEMLIPAKVTERIMPGVVDIPQGAWFDPDETGVEKGGAANVLTRDKPSPGGAPTYNTCLVQCEKT